MKYPKSKGHGCFSCETIGILICVLIATVGAKSVSTRATPEVPCSHGGTINGEILEEHRTISSLYNRILSVISLVNATKQITIPQMLSPSEIPTGYHFLPEEQYSTTGGNFSTDSLDAAGQFKYFYEEIFKLKSYIDEAAKFTMLLGENSIEGDLKRISIKIQEILCDTLIEFTYHDGDNRTLLTSHDLSPQFFIPAEINNLYNESRRAYIFLNDCESLMSTFITLVKSYTP